MGGNLLGAKRKMWQGMGRRAGTLDRVGRR
jgi:hypothetical protein